MADGTPNAYRLQALLARAALALFSALPPRAASGLGGWIGRRLGPRLGASRKAERNLERRMPELDAAARRRVIAGMWDNLARTIAEMPHVPRLYADGLVTVEGAEHLAVWRDRPGLMFASHYGNWELTPLAIAGQGFVPTGVYRAPNNPWVDAIVRELRARNGFVRLFPKGPSGARAVLRELMQKGCIGLLVDQKMNDGIAVPFFGAPAMTAPAIAELALRFDIPVVPMRVLREGGCRFRVVIEPPMELARTGDKAADVLDAMTRINARIESWVRERPDHWLWVHRRWPDS
ncbi:MAG TPA: lauroyl acyltransferase [Alphaproteobacteria bacterium]|nr:lauroyl acyltransferase [Alphaproteobacteria bacterium]